MATYAGKLNVGGTTIPIGSTLYGTCSTAAGTVAKVVTMPNFDTLLTGVTIHVKFTNSNTVANPTLNVNGTGAKAIFLYGTTRPGTNAGASWNAGAIVSFTYDGTNWFMNDWLNSTYTVPAAATANPLMDGTAAVGTSTLYSRQDHVHPSDTSKQDVLTAGNHIDITGDVISVDSLVKDEYTLTNYGLACYAMKSGQTVVIAVMGNNTSALAEGTVIMTVPERFRADGVFGSVQMITPTKSGYIEITADGKVTLKNIYDSATGARGSLPAGAGCRFHVTYINRR